MSRVSQRTIAQMIGALRATPRPEWTVLLYGYGFPDWFVIHAESEYGWDWVRILIEVNNGRFLFSPYSYGNESITGDEFMSADQARLITDGCCSLHSSVEH